MTASQYIDENGNVLPEPADYWGKNKPTVSACRFSGKAYAEHNMYWNNCVINASGVLLRRSYAIMLSNSPF